MLHYTANNWKITTFVGMILSLSYWVFAQYIYPEESLIQHLIFRISGDAQYFPLVEALSRFELHQTFTIDGTSQGFTRFPIANLIIHSLLFSVFGVSGFIIADALFVTLSLFAFGWLIQGFGIRGLVVVSAGAVLWALASSNSTVIFIQFFAGFRFPRTITTGPILLISLALLFSFFRHSERISINKFSDLLWPFAIGASGAVLLQGTFYAFLLWLTCATLLLLVHVVLSGFKLKKSELIAIFTATITLFIFSLPLMVQSIYGSTDMELRFGVFPLSSEARSIYLSYLLPSSIDLMFFVVIAILGAYLFRINADSDVELRNLLIIIILSLSGFVAPILFAMFSPKIVVPSYLMIISNAGYVLALMILSVKAYDALTTKMISTKLSSLARNTLPTVAISLSVAFYLFNSLGYASTQNNLRSDFFNVPEPVSFRKDIDKVFNKLSSLAPLDQQKVLLTNDQHILTWWIMSGRQYLLMPDSFSTTLSNADLEHRVVSAASLLGWTGDDLKRWILVPPKEGISPRSKVILWLSHMYYVANSAYTRSSIDDYSVDPSEVTPMYTNNAHLPNSVINRITNAVEKITPQTLLQTDIIVWLKDGSLPNVSLMGDYNCDQDFTINHVICVSKNAVN